MEPGPGSLASLRGRNTITVFARFNGHSLCALYRLLGSCQKSLMQFNQAAERMSAADIELFLNLNPNPISIALLMKTRTREAGC